MLNKKTGIKTVPNKTIFIKKTGNEPREPQPKATNPKKNHIVFQIFQEKNI